VDVVPGVTRSRIAGQNHPDNTFFHRNLVTNFEPRFADGSQEVSEGDMVDRSRLMVDTRKWLLSKMFPKKYGDKVSAELSGPDGRPIQTENTIVEYIRPKDQNS